EPLGPGLPARLERRDGRSGQRPRAVCVQSLAPGSAGRAAAAATPGQGADRAHRPGAVPPHRRAALFRHPRALWLLLVRAGGAMSAPDVLPEGLGELVPAYLGRQRWYAGSSEPDSAQVR